MFGHAALITQYETRLRELKEAHATLVAALRSQIETLTALVRPQALSGALAGAAQEADAAISGNEDISLLTPEQQAEIRRIDEEASRILSGTYDNFNHGELN